jgi:D-tagatose-1,6-bisphosphate aldolase subunit GatZ/KbaZ
MKAMLDFVRRHKSGQLVGVYSVCSSHPLVIEATMRCGLENGREVLIEATSNQVNQDGGYTGMTPAAFDAFASSIAQKVGFPRDRLLLGGDHLGPNCWQGLPAEIAMSRSDELIDSYVAAGFRKIHLDCSMACAGDPDPLDAGLVARRAARLCAVAERAWKRVGGEPPVYVVGTEVPVPGGASESLGQLTVTLPAAARATLDAHREAFTAAGAPAAWSRVIALVVQPGVEFDHEKVIDYRPEDARALSKFIESEPHIVFEAHSTDYQTPANLAALVRDHFAILKVGPAATFALRQSLWALADIEREWLGRDGSRFKEVVLGVMQASPDQWKKYYRDGHAQRYDLQFSLSDRIRYYWTHPDIQKAQATMIANLEQNPPPLALLNQYLPREHDLIRRGQLGNDPHEILIHGIQSVIRQYADACAPVRRPMKAERPSRPEQLL